MAVTHPLAFRQTVAALVTSTLGGSAVLKFRLAGSKPWRKASATLIKPATPAAVSRWPMLVLREPRAQRPEPAAPKP